MTSLPRSAALPRPALHILVEVEELPRFRLVCGSYEDERRLRLWLAHPATRRALVDAILDELDRLAFQEAA
jgi:hypothetical protein